MPVGVKWPQRCRVLSCLRREASASAEVVKTSVIVLIKLSTVCGSVHPEPPPTCLVELLGPEAVRPRALVVLLGEVARALPREERLAHRLRVALVARAPRGGRDVHHVAPALLVGD